MSSVNSGCQACVMGSLSIYGPTLRRQVSAIETLKTGRREFPARRRIFREGDKITEIFTIRAGWAFRYRELSDGERQILSFFIPGDIIPLESVWMPNSPLLYSVKSLTNLAVCALPLPSFCKMLQASDEQIREVENAEYRFLHSLYGRFVHMGRKSARSRMAHFFLDIEARLRRRGLTEGATMFFPLRQEHLADSLGLTTTHVNRSLAKFRSEGILTLERQVLSILDRQELAKASDEP